MTNIIVYKLDGLNIGDQRRRGMRETADRMVKAINDGKTPHDVVNGTLQDLISELDPAGSPLYRVSYTHPGTGTECTLTNDIKPAGIYEYTYQGAPQKLKIMPRKDKQGTGAEAGMEIMNVVVPRDAPDPAKPGYLGTIIDDLGGSVSIDNCSYLLGTIFLRRCR